MYKIIELSKNTLPINESLKDRINSTSNEVTMKYLIVTKEEVLAYCAVDHYPSCPTLVLYELYVLKNKRNQGVGAFALEEVEKLAMEEGYTSVSLYLSPPGYN